jgi:hypothetical protein
MMGNFAGANLSMLAAYSAGNQQLPQSTDIPPVAIRSVINFYALSKAGVSHEIYFLPGNDHSFDVNWGGFGSQIARAKINDFLERY